MKAEVFGQIDVKVFRERFALRDVNVVEWHPSVRCFFPCNRPTRPVVARSRSASRPAFALCATAWQSSLGAERRAKTGGEGS